MNIVLLGPQGSGKGTQGKRIAEELGIPHISTGSLLRELAKQDTPLADKVRETINAGDLVSDELLMDVLKDRLEHDDADGGFVLDGTPRNMAQAALLEQVVDIDEAIFIQVPDEESVRRISARYHCPKDGTHYNLLVHPPENDMVCDLCGTRIEQREDDTPEAVRKRLAIYHERTKPVVEHFRELGELIEIDGDQPIEDVWEDIRSRLDAL